MTRYLVIKNLLSVAVWRDISSYEVRTFADKQWPGHWGKFFVDVFVVYWRWNEVSTLSRNEITSVFLSIFSRALPIIWRENNPCLFCSLFMSVFFRYRRKWVSFWQERVWQSIRFRLTFSWTVFLLKNVSTRRKTWRVWRFSPVATCVASRSVDCFRSVWTSWPRRCTDCWFFCS